MRGLPVQDPAEAKPARASPAGARPFRSEAYRPRAMRKQSEKKVFYRVKEGRAYRKAMASMVDRVVDTFGGAAVSYILENPASLQGDQLASLKAQVERRRSKEKRDG